MSDRRRGGAAVALRGIAATFAVACSAICGEVPAFPPLLPPPPPGRPARCTRPAALPAWAGARQSCAVQGAARAAWGARVVGFDCFGGSSTVLLRCAWAAGTPSPLWAHPGRSGRAARFTATPPTPTKCTSWNHRRASRLVAAAGAASTAHPTPHHLTPATTLHAQPSAPRSWCPQHPSPPLLTSPHPHPPAAHRAAVCAEHQPRRGRPARGHGPPVPTDIR